MKKIILLLGLLLMANAVTGLETSIVDQEDLSLKAGPSEPGEKLAVAWLEAYVYPKILKDDRIVSLGVRLTSRVKSVSASFDFSDEKTALTSSDGMQWSAAFRVPENVPAGLHVARYLIQGSQGSIQRTVDFFVNEAVGVARGEDNVGRGEAVYAQGWPLTVTATCPAMVGSSIRILYGGQKVVGVSKVPWYKIVFKDGQEGWVPAYMVKEPLSEYYELGYEAFRAGNYAVAIECYKNTVAIDPGFVKGYLWLAKSYYRARDLDSAYRSIMEAMRLDERDINPKIFAEMLAKEYYGIAHAKFKAGRYNESVASYQKVVDLKPGSVASWMELGKCYEKLGFMGEARSAWREARKLEIDLPEVRVARKEVPAPVRAAAKAETKLPPALSDDSLIMVKETVTKKGTKIESALKSVITLTKSLGTPVVEKGWEISRQGQRYLVRYNCEQGAGMCEVFEWLVDVDSNRVSASNDNARLLMDRW